MLQKDGCWTGQTSYSCLAASIVWFSHRTEDGRVHCDTRGRVSIVSTSQSHRLDILSLITMNEG